MALRILVCGGRDYGDTAAVFDALDRINGGPSGPISVLIHGAASGADSLASDWANERGVESEAYPAHWRTEGRKAGPLRNRRMLKEGRPDMVVFFPGDRGTLDMIRCANRAGVPVCPGHITPSNFNPAPPSLHPAQPSQDVAGTSGESLAGLSKEGSETP